MATSYAIKAHCTKKTEETYQTLVGEARGRIIETTRSEDKAAEGGEQTFKYALTYWKETVDGEVVFEADLMANKLIIGGKDVRAGIRAALGL